MFNGTKAAFAEAQRSVREYLSDAVPPPGLRFEITDRSGRVVLVVPFGTAEPLQATSAA